LNSTNIRRVLVTGGCGFIGSHVVDRLVKAGHIVTVVDDLSSGNLANIGANVKRGAVQFKEADVRDRGAIDELVRDVDAVIHLAAIVSVPFSVENPDVTFDVNVEGTRRLLKSCVASGVKRFIHVSSCAVYGAPQYLPIDEAHPTGPISPYAVSKLESERCCEEFAERFSLGLVVLRFFNVYGVRQAAGEYSGVITKFLERVENGQPLVIYGDGLQTRDFVNVADVADAMLTLLDHGDVQGVFNVGSGKAVSINDLAKTVLRLSDRDCCVIHEPPREGDIVHSVADISKAREAFGYAPKVVLKEGLQGLLLDRRGAAL
jgi:UDP-glucose 4-epimerase